MTSFLSISLTREEEALFDLLQQSVNFHGRTTTLRVAGGWVRDKLLRKDNHDIDIALDDQCGIEFANGVNAFLQTMGMETRTVAVIQANPDQSKHLETANLRVLGFEIDCVHLRAETYTDTRIPEVRVGTALEDALRRDFNINALFYNLKTREIEDFTGKGLSDLRDEIICTPLSADITFHDDPLRVLRAIRFSSRLNFRLEASLITAARSEPIRRALGAKVSKERINKELEGMLGHPSSRPLLSASLLHHLQLLDVVLPLREYFVPEGATSAMSASSLSTVRVAGACHPLCAPWFASFEDTHDLVASGVSSMLLSCPLCQSAAPHISTPTPRSPCWQTNAVETLAWVQSLLQWRQSFPSAGRVDYWLREVLASKPGPLLSAESLSQPVQLSALRSTAEITAAPVVDSKVLFFASLLMVTGKCPVREMAPAAVKTEKGKGKGTAQAAPAAGKDVLLCERILRDQLKMDNATGKAVQLIVDQAFELIDFLDLTSLVLAKDSEVTSLPSDAATKLLSGGAFSDPQTVLQVAQWVRVTKERWEETVIVAVAFMLMRLRLLDEDLEVSADMETRESVQFIYHPFLGHGHAAELLHTVHLYPFTGRVTTVQRVQLLLSRVLQFVTCVHEHYLDEIWLQRPVLDGSDLVQRLGGAQTVKGPIVGRLLEAQWQWLVLHRHEYSGWNLGDGAAREALVSALVQHLQSLLASGLR